MPKTSAPQLENGLTGLNGGAQSVVTRPDLTEAASDVMIRTGKAVLPGQLSVPPGATSLVLVACSPEHTSFHRHSQAVAGTIRDAGIGTLVLDLLTQEEHAIDGYTHHLRFDTKLLGDRLVDAMQWAGGIVHPANIGLFGSATAGGAALVAAAIMGEQVSAVVLRGGRPDLAADSLPAVKAPTLLIVGGGDYPIIEINRNAWVRLRCERDLMIVPRASHRFEEPGTLAAASRLTAQWFKHYCG